MNPVSLPTFCEIRAEKWAKMSTFIRDKKGRCRGLAIRSFLKDLTTIYGLDENYAANCVSDTLNMMRLKINAEED